MIRRATLVLALVLGACTAGYRGQARPVDPASLTAEAGWQLAPAPEVRQVDQTDCGPASLAMIAGRWQLALDRDAIVRALPPDRGRGARLGALRDVARAHGLRAYAIAGDRDVLAYELGHGRPVLIGLVRPIRRDRGLPHFEVVVGVHRDGRVATIDPSRGWQVRPWSALEAEWRLAGHAALVVLGPRSTGASARR